MTAVGHQETCRCVRVASALAPMAARERTSPDVRDAPTHGADLSIYAATSCSMRKCTMALCSAIAATRPGATAQADALRTIALRR
jgi:hypothetical protein